MCDLRTWAWAGIVAAVAAAPATAQQPTATTPTAGPTTASTISSTGAITGGNTTGGTSTSGSTDSSTGQIGGTELMQLQQVPQLTAPTGTAASSLHSTNRFAGFYANPYFQGNTIQQNTAPGGFGIATAGTAGRGAVTTGAGRTGAGGANRQASQNQSGILIPIPAQISYTARMQFATPPVAAGKIVGEVRSVLDNTNAIANPKAVEIVTDAANNVTLRGRVKDDDESRLIEGLVRLTPGVRDIKNELAYPVSVNK